MSIMFGDFCLDAHSIVSVKFLFSVVTISFSRQGSESHGKTVFARQRMSMLYSVSVGTDGDCVCIVVCGLLSRS